MIRFVLLLALTLPGPAAAFEVLPGTLTATDACAAYVGIRQRRNPDDSRLAVGERYAVRGRNRPGGAWLQVELPDAEPPERWVEETCGTLAVSTGQSAMRPLFDLEDEGSVDPAPPPPALTALDRAVLAVCGPWGSRPRRAAFRAMLDRPELAPELAAARAAVGGRRPDDELARVWFAADGFRHVFCGEPRADDIAGLHYRGRLLELQETGLIGLADASDCRREIDPPTYSVGLVFRVAPDGPLATACPHSYAADLGAADLLLAGLRAWQGSDGREMCLARLGRGRWAVAVFAADGIRTFYPDASPRCDDGGRPAACACRG